MRNAAVLQWTLGDRLRKAREVAGLTQGEVADGLRARGIKCRGHSTVSMWETGTQPRNILTVIEAWAEVCDVPAEWLLVGDRFFLSRKCETISDETRRAA